MTSNRHTRGGWLLVAFFVALLGFAPGKPASAQDLDGLRASGAVGERYDGYAEARDPSQAGLVQQVNAKRDRIYRQRAAEQGISPAEVGQVYAEQILRKSPSGTFFLRPNGTWTRKP